MGDTGRYWAMSGQEENWDKAQQGTRQGTKLEGEDKGRQVRREVEENRRKKKKRKKIPSDSV